MEAMGYCTYRLCRIAALIPNAGRISTNHGAHCSEKEKKDFHVLT